MIHEMTTTLPPDEVLQRAKAFFAGRVPATAAFPEKEGTGYVVLRGQGGEELVFAARQASGGTMVRGSTLLFDQQVKRFFTTLPEAPAGQAA